MACGGMYPVLPENMVIFFGQSSLTKTQRNLHPQKTDTREQLLERTQVNMRIPRE
jgi:hypothetical protein